MAYKKIIVIPIYQLWANDFQDVRKILIVEHLPNIFPTLW